MHRGIIAIGALILGVSQLSAQTEHPLPEDAQSLRGSYEEARERALQPVVAKYKVALEKLLDAHTKAGRLDNALAIRKEIESLEGPVSSNDAEQPKESSKVAKLRAELSGSRWEIDGFRHPVVMALEPDGSISYEPSEGAPRISAWHLDESGDLFTNDPIAPEPRKATFERGNKQFSMYWGVRLTATRLKDK